MKQLFYGYIIIVCWMNLSCGDSTANAAKNSNQKREDSVFPLIPFLKKDGVNPVLVPGTGSFFCPVGKKKTLWEEKEVFNPAIVEKNNKIYMLYRAQDKAGTSRIGLAESDDGIHFTKKREPVFYPDNDALKKFEWPGGCEDPRVVEDSSGTYYMTYTAFDGKLARLMIAVSKDLLNWTKDGPAFANAYAGKYANKWSKSGSIISKYENGKIIAARIHGKYWMYWGDQNIWIATSDDLVNWVPVEMAAKDQLPIPLKGQAINMPRLKIVISTRNKKFDSDLIESGPPAMLMDEGILLVYNSRNIPSIGDTALPKGTYAASQALLDKDDPTKILKRMDSYFIKPEKPYEISGQVNNVCFVEGLARFHRHWFLYYGTADSKIAVAIKE